MSRAGGELVNGVRIEHESWLSPDECGALTVPAGYFIVMARPLCAVFDYCGDDSREGARAAAHEWAESLSPAPAGAGQS